MKTGVEHRVPLSGAALVVLSKARPLADGSDLVFPVAGGSGKTPVRHDVDEDSADNGAVRQATVHGFRSSFKVWCMERTDTPWAVSEAALAHTLGGSTEQAYARSDLFEKRRALMQRWAAGDEVAGRAGPQG